MIERNGSIYLESTPDPTRDSILINIDPVIGKLDELGVSQDEFGFLLSRKLKIHYWIFEVPREGALIPIGKHLFGEFSWENAQDVVYCRKVMRLSTNIPQGHWQLWVQLLLAYNDMASSRYRGIAEPDQIMDVRVLEQAVTLFKHNVYKYVLPMRTAEKFPFRRDLLPHVEFVAASVERAEDQLSLGRLQHVVVALETALTNFHEMVMMVQPPEAESNANGRNERGDVFK